MTITTHQLAHSLQRLLDAQRDLDHAEEIGDGYSADRHELALAAVSAAERGAEDLLAAYYVECVEVEAAQEQDWMAASGQVFA